MPVSGSGERLGVTNVPAGVTSRWPPPSSFLASPLEVVGTDSVNGLKIGENALQADASGALRPLPTGRDEIIGTGLIFRAIGYRGTPFPGLPFDDRSGTIPNDAGRVLGETNTYVTGWIKRGCRGIIGTNRRCAQQTVDRLLADLGTGSLPPLPGAAALLPGKRIDLAGWKRIDRHERDMGRRQNRPRVKIVDREAQLGLAMSEPATVEACT